jgi:hypothetical protein
MEREVKKYARDLHDLPKYSDITARNLAVISEWLKEKEEETNGCKVLQ